jgi:hypothetical protein
MGALPVLDWIARRSIMRGPLSGGLNPARFQRAIPDLLTSKLKIKL